MPKVVDHEQRRRELADAALSLAARDGLAAVTTRATAAECGWSTGVLNHYFSSRHDLLLAALRRAGTLQGQAYQQIIATDADARAKLIAITESVLPLDDRRLAMTRIFLFFYAEGAAQESEREEIAGFLARWRLVIRSTIAEGQRNGGLDAAIDGEAVAFLLQFLTDGASLEAVVDPATMEAVRSPGFAERCVDTALSARR
ncbi:TetR/AcrR family transcriptional regulator [Tsukamurella soli]|uniref:HTH tetR-type domain-containing protein n=1 Tax=Tsukamurella soli TaxID=644556 RepID=A0ABP8K7V9_9ACTN